MRCSIVSPQPNIIVAVVRMPSWCAVRCTSIHSLRAALQAADAMAHCVVENLGAAAGNRIEAGIAQPGDRVAQATAADLARCW